MITAGTTFIPSDAELFSIARAAAAQGLMLITRVHPVTGRQQTVLATQPYAGWKPMAIGDKAAA